MEFKVGDKVILRDGRKAKIIGNGATVCYVKCKCKDGEVVISPVSCLRPGFPWKKFKKGKFAVHCKAKEEAKDFFKHAKKHGCTWTSGDALKKSNTNWKNFKENTCYDCERDMKRTGTPARICYGRMNSVIDYSSDSNIKFLEWSDYMEG